ncbi:MAG: hypothetical protein IME93_03135 [Proteobacteria bacterium]|nr:hypothetical protein [Pseudomonadota bacterium]
MKHIRSVGGKSAMWAGMTAPKELKGCDWEQVESSLARLMNRNIIKRTGVFYEIRNE